MKQGKYSNRSFLYCCFIYTLHIHYTVYGVQLYEMLKFSSLSTKYIERWFLCSPSLSNQYILNRKHWKNVISMHLWLLFTSFHIHFYSFFSFFHIRKYTEIWEEGNKEITKKLSQTHQSTLFNNFFFVSKREKK